MFLSVIIPTYNRRESLRVTLQGLACQDYPVTDFEVLVVSDGSTDGTDLEVTEYAQAAPYRLQMLSQANAGPARARNLGIQAACGEIVVFIDDDVEPAPGWLSSHARHHKECANAIVIGPMSPDPSRRTQEPAWIAWEHAMLQKQYSAWKSGAWTEIGPANFYSGNASVRRDALLAVGGFDETFARQEDVELAWRLARHSAPTFIFEAQADGLHRPRRTYASWLAVPFAYGRLDVVRARRGDAAWRVVRDSYHARRRATQFLARVSFAVPRLALTLSELLRFAANSAWSLGARNTALAALSVVYNLRYLDGARNEMGHDELKRLLFEAAPPDTVRKEAA